MEISLPKMVLKRLKKRLYDVLLVNNNIEGLFKQIIREDFTMFNKTSKKELWRFIAITLMIIIITIFALSLNLVSLGNKEIYSYILTVSSVMGGFMFAGLGILVSTITTTAIKRFWDGHYLDNLYRASVWGLICDVLSMLIATTILYTNKTTMMNILSNLKIVNPEIILTTTKVILEWMDIILSCLGLTYFIWSFIVLLKVFRRLKKSRF